MLLTKILSYLKRRELKKRVLQCVVEDRSALCSFTEDEIFEILKE